MTNAVPDVAAHALADLISLRGRNAVVTGAAWGLGKATARRLAEAGASVLIGDIDEAGAAELVDGSDGRIAFQACDVTRADQLEALMTRADAEGGIDLLFNNAGAGGAREGIDADEAFTSLAQTSQQRNVKLVQVARELVGDALGG